MTPKLEKQLLKKYPKIFKQHKLPMTQTCMCWGLEVGDGWFWLLDNLCAELQFQADKNGYPQVEATQVKEKYGTLRFYYTFANSEKTYPQEKYSYLDGMISLAEYLTYSICEQCGATNNVKQTEGWIVTLCEKCMKERNDKKD
jgi:hypothetical protein